MQPLISPVDHESRHNSYRAEDENQTPMENTPLLQHFPPLQMSQRISLSTMIVVSILIIVLIAGVIIGIYLLVIQSNSENILPNADTPLHLVSLIQWDTEETPLQTTSQAKANQVIVVQTDTAPCDSLHACIDILRGLKANATKHHSILAYNFLISSNGQTFEALGWRRSSPLLAEYSTALVLAFIGQFSKASPSQAQLDEAKNFLDVSVSLQHLDHSFVIFGKKTKETPTYLFESLKHLPQWDSKLSDA